MFIDFDVNLNNWSLSRCADSCLFFLFYLLFLRTPKTFFRVYFYKNWTIIWNTSSASFFYCSDSLWLELKLENVELFSWSSILAIFKKILSLTEVQLGVPGATNLFLLSIHELNYTFGVTKLLSLTFSNRREIDADS